MKNLVYILIFASFGTHAQAVLEESSLKAVVNPMGKLFGTNGVQFPKNEEKYAFGESVIWISGVNGKDTFVSGNIFGNNTSDFMAGPISEDGTTGTMDSKWNTVYSVSKNESTYHKNNFNKAGYTVSESMKNWQANGGEGFSKILAPFVDWNNNEIYEPTQGDYPYVYGDQMAYTVFNDRGAHGLTGGAGMGMQIENLVSVFGEYGDVATNNIVVNRVLISNKSNKDYSNFKLSILSDFILGDNKDNFVGTDAIDNFIYCYNSGTTDAVYGNKIPALVIFPLDYKDTILSSIYLTNDLNAQTGMPTNKKEFYNYSSGLWKNGKILSYGGSGLDGVTKCNFVYSGTTDRSINGSNWTEANVGNAGGERRMLMTLDLGSIGSKALKTVPLVYAILENYSGNSGDIKALVSEIRARNKEGLYTTDQKIEKSISIYPTIAQAGSEIYINYALDGHSMVSLYDCKGKMVQKIRKSGNNFFILNVGLTSGIYFVKHEGVNGVGYAKLLIQ